MMLKMVIFLTSKSLPKIPIEVAEKVLSPLELQIYKLLLQLEEGKGESDGRSNGKSEK